MMNKKWAAAGFVTAGLWVLFMLCVPSGTDDQAGGGVDNPNVPNAFDYLDFKGWDDGGCISRGDSTIFNQAYIDSIRLNIDTIVVYVIFSANCCPGFVDSVTIDSNAVDVSILDTLYGCRCICEHQGRFVIVTDAQEIGFRLRVNDIYGNYPNSIDSLISVEDLKMAGKQ